MNVVVFGAGGYAAEVVDLLDTLGHRIVAFVAEGNRGTQSTTGVTVVPTLDDVAEEYQGAVIAIGDGSARRHIAESLPSAVELPVLAHPSASVSPYATLGAGTMVMQNAVVNSRATVGECVIVNVAACVAHDVTVGDYCHLAPATQLGGGSSVGSGSNVGTSAVLLPGVSVGRQSVVGAGAVVTRSVPDGTTVAGVPARAMGGDRS